MSTSESSDATVKIRLIRASEYSESCELVLEVFNESNAPECTEEGLNLFYRMATPEVIAKGMQEGNRTWVAVTGESVIGVIKMHNGNHIHFLFVSKDWQGQGVGRRLFEAALLHVRGHHPEKTDITVNSSSNAVPIYRALGFIEAGRPQIKQGIPIVPMQLKI